MFFYIKTLGCKVNQYESEEAEKLLLSYGHVLVDDPAEAGLVIVNTCSVTQGADKKSRQQISKVLKLSQKAEIVVTGCILENDSISQNIIKVQYVPKARLIDTLSERYCSLSQPDLSYQKASQIKKIRKMIKIQDGCNYFCNYCIIPYLRRNQHSIDHQKILAEIREQLEQGIKEFVLTGINVGTYSYEEQGLVALLNAITSLDGDFRVRLSSIEPNLLTESILSVYKSNEKLDRHFHVPLQAVTDKMLRKMNRKYNMEEYRSLVRKILNAGFSLTTDIIIGLPGETETDFLQTISLIKEGIFMDAHFFSYSPRQGTPAAGFPEQVPEQVKKERMNLALLEMREQKRQYLKKLEGNKCTVLVEKRNQGHYDGYSEYYFKVKIVENNHKQFGKFVPVILRGNECLDKEEVAIGEIVALN